MSALPLLALLAACGPTTASEDAPSELDTLRDQLEAFEAQSRVEREALQARIAQLESQVATLGAVDLDALTSAVDEQALAVSDLDGRLLELEEGNLASKLWVASNFAQQSSLENAIADIETNAEGLDAFSGLTDLPTFLTVDTTTNSVVFSGVNVYIDNGSSSTNSRNALGNLFLGYAETDSDDEHTGSHNLVLGMNNTFTSFGGIVGGYDNAIQASYALALGNGNVANGDHSVVLGGSENTAVRGYSMVFGGNDNTAAAGGAVVVGGVGNDATGTYALLVGGQDNTASGRYSTLLGGEAGEASGYASAICGGLYSQASGSYTAVGGGYQNEAAANYSSVGGGYQETTSSIYEFLP